MEKLTEDQIKDIEERVKKASEYLKENGLACAVQAVACNLGAVDKKFNSIFGTYLNCFLQDTKFAPKQENSVKSPLQKEDLK